MKKQLFFLLAVAGALASCSNDETVEVVQTQPKAIGFSSYVDKATRAETNLSTLKDETQGFLVWGQVSSAASGSASILTAEPITWQTSTPPNSWTYTNERYWQPSTKYAFTAIGPGNVTTKGVTYTESAGSNFTANLHGTIGMDISTGEADVDVVYDMQARTTSSPLATGDDNKVEFTFNHILSQVRVVFKNGFSVSGQNIKVTNVKVTSKKKGTLALTSLANPYTLSNFAWTTDASAGNYSKVYSALSSTAVGSYSDALNSDGCIEQGKKGTTTNACYLIPSQTSLDIEFTVQMYSGSQAGGTYAHTGTNKATATISGGLKPGTSYVLTASIDHSNIDPNGALKPITFDVTSVAGWGTDDTSGTISLK